MAGSQLTLVFPATLVALTTACGLALSWVAGTGVKVAGPLVPVSAVMSYRASPAGMVSASVPVPVAKPVDETVAVQLAPTPRSSVTPCLTYGFGRQTPDSPDPGSGGSGPVL